MAVAYGLRDFTHSTGGFSYAQLSACPHWQLGAFFSFFSPLSFFSFFSFSFFSSEPVASSGKLPNLPMLSSLAHKRS
jgi:hypothetical protein